MKSLDPRFFVFSSQIICTVFLAVTMLAPAVAVQAQENADRTAKLLDTKQQTQIDNWLRNDANKDGKLSKDETDGLQKRFFDRNDRNQDGFLDQAELKALAKRLATNQANRTNQNRNTKGTVTTDQLRRKVPDGVTLVPDIAYREGHPRWKLDLLMPTERGAKPRPAIVFVHGGGWRNGDKRKGNFIDPAIDFASKGYVCISVNYRFVPEVPITDIVGDVKCAVRWLRAHADKYNVDPERFGAYGNSAGAHLVSILGICTAEAGMEGDGPWQEHSSMVQAVCASATPTSFLIPMNNRIRGQSPNQKTEAKANPSSDRPGANRDTRPSSTNSMDDSTRKKISPSQYVTADAPPFLLIHDESDKTVSVEQSKTFVAALKKAGAKDVTFKLYDNQSGHGVMQKNIAETGPLRAAFFDRTLRGGQNRSTSSK